MAAYAKSPMLYGWSALQLVSISAFPARWLVGQLFSRRLLANLGSIDDGEEILSPSAAVGAAAWAGYMANPRPYKGRYNYSLLMQLQQGLVSG